MVRGLVCNDQEVFPAALVLVFHMLDEGFQEIAEEQLVVRPVEDHVVVAAVRAGRVDDVQVERALRPHLVPLIRLETRLAVFSRLELNAFSSAYKHS